MLVTAICGSGPAAIGASLPMFYDTFVSMGVSMSAVHRIAAFSATTLDTLPTNAGFIAAAGLARSEAKDSYKYVGCVLWLILPSLLRCDLVADPFPWSGLGGRFF